ncbi:hypothetical protein [Rhodococcus sp. NPDC003348]
MGWRDLAVLLDDAAEQDDRAADLAENVAMLVDREHYWLTSEYASWTTDPDDSEVKAARAQRKRDGVKPPPRPLLAPIARRSTAATAELLAQHLADVARYTKLPDAPLSVAEYNRLQGITGAQP